MVDVSAAVVMLDKAVQRYERSNRLWSSTDADWYSSLSQFLMDIVPYFLKHLEAFGYSFHFRLKTQNILLKNWWILILSTLSDWIELFFLKRTSMPLGYSLRFLLKSEIIFFGIRHSLRVLLYQFWPIIENGYWWSSLETIGQALVLSQHNEQIKCMVVWIQQFSS